MSKHLSDIPPGTSRWFLPRIFWERSHECQEALQFKRCHTHRLTMRKRENSSCMNKSGTHDRIITARVSDCLHDRSPVNNSNEGSMTTSDKKTTPSHSF